jgi:3-oxoacyl-[acyl-carrier-protein] synthase-1
MKPVAILGCGMVTGVGLTAAATCAALRCALGHFSETRFIDQGGEWLLGCQVPLEPPSRGRDKLVHLVVPALRECLGLVRDANPERIPLLLCVAEKERPGRLAGLDEQLLFEVQAALGARFHPASAVIAQGRVGGAVAVEQARRLIHEQGLPLCLVAGVDSFLVGATLAAYEKHNRLLTSKNSDGFIPGEAGTAVLLGSTSAGGGPQLRCLGIGFGKEPATIASEEPLRADGLVAALRAVCADSGCTLDEVGYRLTDLSGEQYGFKEAALAISRTVRKLKAEFDIWHPAGFLGEIGAAIVPCVLGVALAAARKGYAPAPGVLCHFSNDDGARAALILKYGEGKVM